MKETVIIERNGIHYRLYRPVENPTLEQRVDFLEKMLRQTHVHESRCARNFPDIKGRFWNWEYVYKPCDCWLTSSLGTQGIEMYEEYDYEA